MGIFQLLLEKKINPHKLDKELSYSASDKDFPLKKQGF